MAQMIPRYNEYSEREHLQKEIRNLEKKKDEKKSFYLYNILTNQKIEIQSSLPRLTQMIDYLIYHKFFVKNFMNDAEFITMNEEIRQKIYLT
jgi:hypothetical protein